MFQDTEAVDLGNIIAKAVYAEAKRFFAGESEDFLELLCRFDMTATAQEVIDNMSGRQKRQQPPTRSWIEERVRSIKDRNVAHDVVDLIMRTTDLYEVYNKEMRGLKATNMDLVNRNIDLTDYCERLEARIARDG